MNIARGQTVQIAVVFYDIANQIVQPASAKIAISYLNGTKTKTDTYALPYDSVLQKFIYSLNTRGMQPGPVTWSASSTDSLPFYTADGGFTLTANNANLGAVL